MIALPSLCAPAAAPARAAAPADAPADADGDGRGGFAAALEHAREPSTARAADQGAGKQDEADDDAAHGDDAAVDAAATESGERHQATHPDLATLLPGWPPVSPTSAASATAAAADAAGAVQGEPGVAALREARTRVRLLTVDAEPMRSDSRATQTAATQPTTAAHTAGASTPADLPSSTTTAAKLAESATPLAPPALSAATMAATPIASHAAPNAPHLNLELESAAAAAPAFETRLAAAIDTPAFAPALAHRLSWLAREGVQQARITLNPAEMGPLAVRIVLDGTQARIDFSADFAATRAAIEASLPTLAAALHDSGLTLSGGGVFDGQARQGRHDGAHTHQAGQRPFGPAAAADVEADPMAPMRNARGLVDLLA